MSENDFEKTAIAAIKSRHHHNDGSEVKLKAVNEESDFETKIINEENEWKMKKQAQNQHVDVFSKEKSVKAEVLKNDEWALVEPREKTIQASCNCGQLFKSSVSENKSEVKIKAYDVSGKAITYSVANFKSGEAGYTEPSNSYAKQ